MTKQGQEHLSKSGDKRLFWQEKIKLFRESGVGATAFCTQHSLSIKCFHYWRKKYSSADRQSTLIPVAAKVSPILPVVCTLELPSMVKLQIHEPAILLQLLSALI
jgi:hypothetical protein